MSTTADRIAEMIRTLDVDQVEFGALAGASKSVVNQWINGHIKSVSAKYAYALEANTGYRAQWIMLGELPKMRSENTIVREAPAEYSVKLSTEAYRIGQLFDASDPEMQAAMKVLVDRLSLSARKTDTIRQDRQKRVVIAPRHRRQSTAPLPDNLDDILSGQQTQRNPTIVVRGHPLIGPQQPRRRTTDR